jgi:hypothetical protein
MKLLLNFAVLPFTLALAKPPPAGTTVAAPPNRTGAPICGGYYQSGKAPKCEEGQVCAPTQPPNSFDFPGSCVLQSCGGSSPTPRICPLEQVCVYNHTIITDIPGRCLSAKLTCGGREDVRCKEGWDCVKNPQLDYSYREDLPEDFYGICVPPGALVVETPWKGWGA